MSPLYVEIICPNCGQTHNQPYTPDSNWCTDCALHELEDQNTDIQLGQIFEQ